MGFLSGLGDIINNQLGMGENTVNSLDGTPAGRDMLSRYTSQIDKTAERSYLEDGFVRGFRPRTRNLIFQQPDIVVVVKKRMFSSLVENSQLDKLEEKERILISAMKRLFQNKCKLISAYERLTKIEKLTQEAGSFNTHLGPIVLSSLATLSPVLGLVGMDFNDSTKGAFEKLRKILVYSNPKDITTWTTNEWDAVFGSEVGEGPGTFELTNVSNLNTTVSTEFGGGSASLDFEDPYNLMVISEMDIDQAITDVANPLTTGRFFKFTELETLNRIEDLKRQLAISRAARNACGITVIVSEGTVISKRVRAILDGEGKEIGFTYTTGVQAAFQALDANKNVDKATNSLGYMFTNGAIQYESGVIGNVGNQLNAKEAHLLSEIITSTYSVIGFRATSQTKIGTKNKELNYVRNRMRLLFNGKHIIQPMDVINVFITSRTYEDNMLTRGLVNAYSGNNAAGLLAKFDSLTKNISDSMNQLFGRTSFSDLEKNAIVGADFPSWLWNMFKSDITNQSAGTCVFVGLCNGATGSGGNGKFVLKIGCEDNTGYFDKGQINFKPAADVFNSTIYDPLTPFDVSFDASTGVAQTSASDGEFPPLLPENQKLFQTGAVHFRSGPRKGEVATPFLYGGTKDEELSFDTFNRVLSDPAGMVYRWKQGIQTLTKVGRPNPLSSLETERAVLLTEKPFAGQDVMNSLSLLITGQPYNYATFLKAAIANGNSTGFNDAGKPAAYNYIEGLLFDIQKKNAVWGNFVPFKNLTVSRELSKFLSTTSLDFTERNTQLQGLLRERAKLLDDQALLNVSLAKNPSSLFRKDANDNTIPPAPDALPDPTAVTQLSQRTNQIESQIADLKEKYTNAVSQLHAPNPKIGVSLIGSSVDVDPSLISANDSRYNENQKRLNELERRRKLKTITLRRLWDVKSNTDRNLLMVDDQYDNNLDIQAFERKITGNIDVFNSSYSTISENIKVTKELLGLEVFANTQGHIEVRPPGYNKIPSSVFYKMFNDKDTTGVKVFPDFLESLFFNQLQAMFSLIETVEDEIRLRCYALGKTDDKGCVNLIQYGASGNYKLGSKFEFVTNENGKINEGIRGLIMQAHPDISQGLQSEALKTIDTEAKRFSQVAGASILFNVPVQVDIASTVSNLDTSTIAKNIEKIRSRLRIKTGREPVTIKDLYGNNKFGQLGGTVSQLDRLNIISQISNFISDRQNYIKSAASALKSLQEGLSVNAPPSANVGSQMTGTGNFARSVIAPWLNRRTGIPQILDHMIEYEEDDDLGPGSGKRFFIRGHMYSNLTVTETPPPFTMVTVNGLISQGFVDRPGPMNTSSDGNALTSAYAVDYDMWYMYGFKVSPAIPAPFFSDPDSQCAPYAVAKLLQMRENVLNGSITVHAYNEYYQPGDVVYIEDRNLLFYVKSVRHSFSYGGKFDTTLELTYGHSPGEFIPNILDVVGKILYNSRGFYGQFRSDRYDTVGAKRSLGVVVYDKNAVSAATGNENNAILKGLMSGKFGDRNRGVLSNVLLGTSGALNQVSLSRNKATIVLRYYTPSAEADNLEEAARAVKAWLTDPQEFSNSAQQLITKGSKVKNQFGLTDDDIVIERVDLKNATATQIDPPDESDRKTKPNNQGPSEAAWLVARQATSASVSADDLLTAVKTNVIDAFIEYQTVKVQKTQTTDQSSEWGQAMDDEVVAAIGDAAFD